MTTHEQKLFSSPTVTAVKIAGVLHRGGLAMTDGGSLVLLRKGKIDTNLGPSSFEEGATLELLGETAEYREALRAIAAAVARRLCEIGEGADFIIVSKYDAVAMACEENLVEVAKHMAANL